MHGFIRVVLTHTCLNKDIRVHVKSGKTMWPRQTHCGRSTSSTTLDPEKLECMQILTNNKCPKSLELNLTSLLIEQLCTVHHLLDGIIQYLTQKAPLDSGHMTWPAMAGPGHGHRPHLTSCFGGRVKVCPITKLSLLDQERPQPAAVE